MTYKNPDIRQEAILEMGIKERRWGATKIIGGELEQ
jgi:hypothetical protein